MKDSYSEHYLTLKEADKQLYLQKLTVDGHIIKDPYTLPPDCWEKNCRKWPNVQYCDVRNYLKHSPGLYTQEAMKSYKSLDTYNYIVSPRVQEILYHDVIDTSVCILAAKVVPSQSVDEKKQLLHPWLLLEKKTGSIVAAHCTCTSKGCEVCSHIAAVLIKVASFPSEEISFTKLLQIKQNLYNDNLNHHAILLASKKNYAGAVGVWRMVVLDDNTHQKSLYNLALCYEKGLGLRRDLHQARRFYTQCAEQGNEKAKMKVNSIKQNISDMKIKNNISFSSSYSSYYNSFLSHYSSSSFSPLESPESLM